MKLLKIEAAMGHFLVGNGDYAEIDRITKEDLLRLANITLQEGDVEFDAFDERLVKNLAHQVIYKNVVQKLQSLRARKQEFVDESERLYLVDYEKYRKDLTE